ncbi:hypothetical protein ACT6QG_11140 [Xanthobacter sp. TB0136]|uniref:hypothetical protein n=1 Tax=Xanthobacter sp. TB0136 TaxID=3459177 RepID=UPI00403A1BFA
MADNSDSKAGANLDALRQELDQMRSELSKFLDNAGETARSKVKEAAASAEEAAHEASRIADKGCTVLRDTVREQPVASLAVAAGLGFIASLLLLRR